ncbi:MAG: hypothetical protein CMB64_01020, partial [Euryarchaeota archaeon]|nr:hypothetical protein [Euryarchaeota archaeon]
MQTKLSVNKAVFLTLIMILMTQTGYLENISNFEEIETNNSEKLSSNGGSNNLTPSVEGADLFVGQEIENITFQYGSSAASGSGSGSGSGTTNGNGTTWQLTDINPGNGNSLIGQYMEILVGDTLYFSAWDGSTGIELWAYDTSNASTWQVADIRSGTDGSVPGRDMSILVGDTLYFDADDGISGYELWAHDTSNSSTWQVADLASSGAGGSNFGGSDPGKDMSILVGDTLYFDATGNSGGQELWAHDTSNASTWQVADIYSGTSASGPGKEGLATLVGDTLYFSANGASGSGHELWAHDTSNASTWQVAEINSVGWGGSSNPGYFMATVVGDTLYFSADDGSSGVELWAHDTSNSSTWQVADIKFGTGDGVPGLHMSKVIGDTLYFDAYDGISGYELWAHDTSNSSTWQVA